MPFIEADLLDQSTTHFAASLDDGPFGPELPVVGTPKICRYDITDVSVGTHNIRLKAIRVDGVWGRQESVPSTPFVFTKPVAPDAPTGLRLVI